MIGVRDLVFLGCSLGAVAALASWAFPPPSSIPYVQSADAPEAADGENTGTRIIADIDALFQKTWRDQHLTPAPPADHLLVIRRLSLALTGGVTSLEEIRALQSMPVHARIAAHRENLLRDRRSADYLAERFARAFVGVEEGPFLLFRRRRFVSWLSDEIHNNQRFDRIVRAMIADNGLWTDHPAVNFVTVTWDPEKEQPDPERLAARVARAFLGMRIDCARCHNHPFESWTQSDFQGLAAYFGGVSSNLRGIHDKDNSYKPVDVKTQKIADNIVTPQPPFARELVAAPQTKALPSRDADPDADPEESDRACLADWIVDRRNPSLARATVNRVWAVMFGKPLVEPIDEIPPAGATHPVLDRLAEQFIADDFDLRKLVRTIASLEVFRLDSALPETDVSGKGRSDADEIALENAWGVFPITRLRPEQVAGSLFQASGAATLGPQSGLLTRLTAMTGKNDFIQRYGDAGEDEFLARGGTIPQRLLLMNGEILNERIKPDLFGIVNRLAELAPDDQKLVETAYLMTFTRLPTPEENLRFTQALAGSSGDERKEIVSDLFWTLVNAAEFSWNH